MKTKVCSKCKLRKSIDQFNKKGRDRLQTECRVCSNLHSRLYYANNKAHHQEVINERRRVNKKIARQLIIDAKNKPCADCGVLYPAFVMDFDHRDPKLKKHVISQMPSYNYSVKRIQEEINKCDVVCSNCHRYRTFRHKL